MLQNLGDWHAYITLIIIIIVLMSFGDTKFSALARSSGKPLSMLRVGAQN